MSLESICSLRLDFEMFSTIKSLTDSLETNGGTCTDTFIARVVSLQHRKFDVICSLYI